MAVLAVGNLQRLAAVTQRARAHVQNAVAVSLAALGASACHHARAATSRTQPAPAVRAIAAAAPTLTDRQWIDSVAQSWAAHQSSVAPSTAVRPSAARGGRQSGPAVAVASSEPTTSAVSYAEAAASEPAPIADDDRPLIVICAIGVTSLLIAVTAARVAIGG